jgi:hypothetical protein
MQQRHEEQRNGMVKTKCVTSQTARLPLDRCREVTLLPSHPTKEKCHLAALEGKWALLHK